MNQPVKIWLASWSTLTLRGPSKGVEEPIPNVAVSVGTSYRISAKESAAAAEGAAMITILLPSPDTPTAAWLIWVGKVAKATGRSLLSIGNDVMGINVGTGNGCKANKLV